MHKTRRDAISAIQAKAPVTAMSPVTKVSDIYGVQTFNEKAQKQYLTADAIEKLKRVAEGAAELDNALAAVVAEGVRKWALSLGATHFTHWFQPLTGLTAEKHDSFISYDGSTSAVVEKFSASQLIKSEPDASSFPSGGMRSTFEARGYTAWDASSPIFVIENGGTKTLCIPSVFVSYTGESLDTKTALLHSVDALSKAAVGMLSEMGEKASYIHATIGCEQEYFLIDRHFVDLRPDLLLAGRTLLGAESPKGQQLEDQYFGSIPARVQAYMAEVETELYKLGVPVKTRHNEVAPGQYETAPIFEDANVAADHNMLTMEVLRRVALRHGFVCLLHEKPFAGINGSGKHNNWSMATDKGENLLEPGKTPHSNFRFLAVLSCVLNAVHKNQVALRAAIASHGNDHRLGANEAPPAIISAFLGSTLTQIVEAIESGADLSKQSAEKSLIEFGINRIATLPRDSTDRNRTSPFAFTGNKFEFRAVGSSHQISFPVSVLNAAVAESMMEFTELLKKNKQGAVSIDSAVLATAREFFARSKTIRFEGNGYSEEWKSEARKRGLHELLKTPESLAAFLKKENHEFLVKTGVYTDAELEAVVHIRLEQYAKHLDIEAKTMAMMIEQAVVPAAQQYLGQLGLTKAAGGSYAARATAKIEKVGELLTQLETGVEKLHGLLDQAHLAGETTKVATFFAEQVAPLMITIRAASDELETYVPDELWPLPRYREMLFIR